MRRESDIPAIRAIGWGQVNTGSIMTIRPRRSVLYMPGSNARAIEKARTLPADAISVST